MVAAVLRPRRMIDIHAHILPGCDDGARSLADAVEMARIAWRTGTTDLVATPHANFDHAYHPAQIEQTLADLRAAIGSEPRLHTGCDLHLSPQNIEDALAHPGKYAVNHKAYVLVEFPDVLIPPATEERFSAMLEAGMIPVITHPERNFLLHRRVDDLEHWVGLGCRIQVTAQSLTGRFGREARRFARRLLRLGLVHFVASDAHDPRDRTPRLDEAYCHVARHYGPAYADLLFTLNPKAVLTGEPLAAESLEPPRPLSLWRRIWRGR